MIDVLLAKLGTRESEIERYSYFPPYGILYIASSLEKEGFKVRLVHQEGTEKNIQNLAELAARETPFLIGLSTLTGPTLLPTIEASKAIRQKYHGPIVWGGHHPTILPEQTLGNEFVDIIVLGEGEKTMVELARVIKESGPRSQGLTAVSGIAFKNHGQTILTKARSFIDNLDELSPAWHHLDRNQYLFSENVFRARHLGKMKVATIITSRGCPWRCRYCYNQKVNRRTFRAQSPEKSIQEVFELKERFHVDGIVFEDDNFFTDQRRAMEIVRRIQMPWSATFRANDIADGGRDFVRELKENHCLELRIGAESGSQRMLDALDKDLTVEQIKQAALLCEETGITAAFMFMVGFPGETWEDICLTLDLIDELSACHQYVMVTQLGSYTPYPGTPLFDQAVRSGFCPPVSTAGWGTFVQAGYREYLPAYVDRRARSLTYYHQLSMREDLNALALSLPAKAFQKLARLRWKHRFFSLPLDHSLPVFSRQAWRKPGCIIYRSGCIGSSQKCLGTALGHLGKGPRVMTSKTELVRHRKERERKRFNTGNGSDRKPNSGMKELRPFSRRDASSYGSITGGEKMSDSSR
jgi:anaerobic magnesium-protoporphyrin IX monomethyl ester cyclase